MVLDFCEVFILQDSLKIQNTSNTRGGKNMPIMAIMAGVSAVTTLFGMGKSEHDAKKQKKMAEKQARIKEGLINENYVAKMNNLQKDYVANFYDRNNAYAHALNAINNQEDQLKSNLEMSVTSQGAYNSSYYSDMKTALADQYVTAMADAYSTKRINDLRGAMSYSQTREQEKVNRKQNVEMTRAQMDASINQINAQNRATQTNGMFNLANTAVNYAYQSGAFVSSVPNVQSNTVGYQSNLGQQSFNTGTLNVATPQLGYQTNFNSGLTSTFGK